MWKKANLWRQYSRACAESSSPDVGLTKLKNIWKLYLPHIAIVKISSDLCDTFQQNNNFIMKSVNCTEAEKSARLKQQEDHLALAKECRAYYKQQCRGLERILELFERWTEAQHESTGWNNTCFLSLCPKCPNSTQNSASWPYLF